MPCKNDKTPLESGCYYHVYNRGINRERLFLSREHFDLFLARYYELMNYLVETYCYCLISNHFHFVFRIKDSNGFDKLVSKNLNKLFSQHALLINKESNRYGSLFCKSFKRIKITNEHYLKNLIVYVHENPTKHGLTKNYKSYPYSSYQEIILNTSKLIDPESIFYLFGGYPGFIEHHESNDPFYRIVGKLIIEKQ